MDKTEFDAWKLVTKNSENEWQLDRVTYHNRGDMLFYKGGVDGIYLRVDSDGTVAIGNYQGALPHIGEAAFTVIHSNKVADSAEEALSAVLPKLDLLGMEAFLII